MTQKLHEGARSSWIETVCDTVLPAAFIFSYIAFFAAVSITNNVPLPTQVMRGVVIPCCALSVISMILRPPATQSFLDVARRLSRSCTLWALLAYLIFLTLATYMRTDAPRETIDLLAGLSLRRSIDVFVFVFVTAYLVLIYKPFLRIFFIAAAIILSINATVNLIAFVKLVGISGLIAGRLQAVFGTPQFINSTHVGPLWVVYGLAVLALVATVHVSRIERAIVAVAAPILFCAALATQSRGALVTLIVGLLMIAVASSKRWRILTASVVVIGLLLCAFISPLRDALLSRGMSFRTALWQEYFMMTLRQNPLMGFGLQRELWVKIDGFPFEQPHNTVIWGYVRGGVGAALACLCMMVSAVYWSVRHWLRTGNLAPAAAITALLITSVTEIGFLPRSANWLWIMFWLPLGLGAGTELVEQRPLEANEQAAQAHAVVQ